MNCCDEYGDCRQGRDCPVRKSETCRHCFGIGYDASGYPCTCTTPASVAKVGKRMHGPKPLQGSQWRGHLKDLARVALLTIAVMLVSALTVALIPKGVRYDCATAEFHPDVPKAVKTQCRKERTTA